MQKALFYLLVVAALVAAAAAETTELAARAVGAAAMLLFLGATIPRLGTQGRLLVAIILPVGHALIVGFSPALDTWAAAMSAGGDFAPLIGAVPLAASFIRMERVEEAGPGRAGRKLSLPRIGVIQFGLSIALSIGSLWVARPLYDTLSAPAGSRYRTVAAAYSSNVAFSPLDAMVNLVLVLAGLTYAQYMPFGLGLALVIVAATAAVELGLRIRHHVRGTGHAPRSPVPIEGLGAVLARTAALIALVIAGKALLGMKNEVLETGIVLALVSTALILLVHGPGALRAALAGHPTGLGQLTPAFALISSALFFAGAVGGSPAGDAIVTAGETLAALPGSAGGAFHHRLHRPSRDSRHPHGAHRGHARFGALAGGAWNLRAGFRAFAHHELHRRDEYVAVRALHDCLRGGERGPGTVHHHRTRLSGVGACCRGGRSRCRVSVIMSNATPDTFICLAAGKGTRMGRLSSYLQKCMYPLDGFAEQYRVRHSSIRPGRLPPAAFLETSVERVSPNLRSGCV